MKMGSSARWALRPLWALLHRVAVRGLASTAV